MANLADILQSEVASEISALATDAEAKVQATLQAATAKAEAIRANKQRQLESEHAAALRRAESAAELMVNQARIAARGRAVDQVKSGALSALQKLASGSEFGAILTKLAEEALAGIGKAEAVVVNPAHASLLQGWAQSKGLKLVSDASVNYGVRLVAEGGKSYVQNSLTERLERAWDSLSARAAKALWG